MKPRTSIVLSTLSLLLISSLSLADSGDTRNVIEPTEYGYAQANVVFESSPMVYVAGQVGISNQGSNDFESQVDRSFDNLVNVLSESGSSINDVVKITLLIVDFDPDKLAYMVKKRNEVFGNQPPASTLVPVTRLYTDGVKFEIDAIAVKRKSNSIQN